MTDLSSIHATPVADPILSTAEAAEVLGGDERGIRVLMKCGKLAYEPKSWGKRIIFGFRRSTVDEAKPFYQRLRDFQNQGFHKRPELGTEYTLLKASEKFQVPLCMLQKAVAEGDLPTADVDPPPTGSKPWKVVLEKDVLTLKVQSAVSVRDADRLNRGRWKTAGEIQKAVGAASVAICRDISACLKCWTQLGWLEHKQGMVRQTGKVPTAGLGRSGKRNPKDLREVSRFRTLTFYDFPRFKRLWERNFIPAGVRRLKELITEYEGRCPARTVAAELEKIGVAGNSRRARVAKAAGVRAVHDWGPGAPNRIVYVPKGQTRPRKPVEVVRSMLESGPVAAGVGLGEAQARGLTIREVYAALKKLGVPLQAKDCVGDHTWELPAAARAPGAVEPSTAAAEPKPSRRRRGRPRGKRDPDVVDRVKRMLEAWDRGEFGANKAKAARAFGFHRSDATKLINAHEKAKCRN